MSDTSSTVRDAGIQYLSPRESARLLSLPGVTARTLRAWAKQGKLPALVLPSGRLLFRREDIEELLEPRVLSAPSAGSPADAAPPGQGMLSWPSPVSPVSPGEAGAS
ncbi:helix-turn-helix domain-containing protein [Actinomyces sp.]|uniref:MerR family transcriptional regulator n=1 Tax=Actinomyces sp. TaxID=29317 RepID=UPI0026DD4A80|nr:helix-turn-helix domain-containing protein [Actinomyces sp.]MDO4901873.1 helix-turn-helix domain-containing protein [Actinomyces sp.]